MTIEEPYVLVHPGASVPARAWSPRRYRSLVARLAAAGVRPVISGSAQERELTRYVASGTPHAIDVGGRTSLAGLGALLRGATAAVVGNTGPAHLAAAVQTPVVSIFAATVEPERWRPWAVPHVLFHEPPPCAGCRARRCPLEVQLCLDRIGVSAVLRAVLRLAAPARLPSLTPGGRA
jgi:ADP-heptose:LPS heptosyltransferase